PDHEQPHHTLALWIIDRQVIIIGPRHCPYAGGGDCCIGGRSAPQERCARGTRQSQAQPGEHCRHVAHRNSLSSYWCTRPHPSHYHSRRAYDPQLSFVPLPCCLPRASSSPCSYSQASRCSFSRERSSQPAQDPTPSCAGNTHFQQISQEGTFILWSSLWILGQLVQEARRVDHQRVLWVIAQDCTGGHYGY
ncbi:hypothetical protein BGZ90_009762, partial [Linnemannia elongata]